MSTPFELWQHNFIGQKIFFFKINLINFKPKVSKDSYVMSISLVKNAISSQQRTWSLDRTTQSWSSYFQMISLAIWSDGTCVTGFVFNFCAYLENCEIRSVGTYNGLESKFLYISADDFYLTKIKSVKGYVDDVVYALEICVDDNDCTMAGNTNNEMNVNIYDSSMNFITSFWGSFSENQSGQRKCLKDFGIDFWSFI
jgi:hypothetical protein